MSRLRRLARPAAVGALAVSALLLAPPAHADERLPFTDANTVGQIGFCDANDKPVTQGSIRDVPFVVKAVSNTPAGKAWAVKGRKAALYATSPNKDLDPRLWSPYQLTPSSLYTDAAHPMTAAGFGEPPLEYHTTGAPPTLDNLVQLRMYLSAPNTAPYVEKYPAAVVRIDGDRWVMVAGDRTPDCTAGSAKNINQLLGKGEPTAPPTWAANAAAAVPGSSSGSSPTTSSDPGAGPAPSGSAAVLEGSGAVASSRTPSAPNVLLVAIALLVGTAVIAAAVIAVANRRRSTAPVGGSHSTPH